MVVVYSFMGLMGSFIIQFTGLMLSIFALSTLHYDEQDNGNCLREKTIAAAVYSPHVWRYVLSRAIR